MAFEEVIQENVLGYISKPLSFPRSHSHRHRRGERDSRDRKEGYGGIITVTSEVEVETETQKQTQTQTSGVENVAVDADTTATPEAPTSDCKVAAEMDGKVKKVIYSHTSTHTHSLSLFFIRVHAHTHTSLYVHNDPHARVKIVAASYEFAERDLVEPRIKLAAGDRVRFNLFLEKRSGRKGATRVQFLGRSYNI